MTPPWICARVEIEDEGSGESGTIVDITETCVGVQMEGNDMRVWYIAIGDLRPAED